MNDQADVDYLFARCSLVLSALEVFEPSEMLSQVRSILVETADRKNLRGLRTIRSDLFAMIPVLPSEQRLALQARLDTQAADDPASRPAS